MGVLEQSLDWTMKSCNQNIFRSIIADIYHEKVQMNLRVGMSEKR